MPPKLVARVVSWTGNGGSAEQHQEGQMLKGFRDFILRGNVIDLAIAVIIGAAFTAVINSLVADVLNPLIAAVVGKPDFSAIVVHVGTGVIKIGNFFNAVIAFLIVAFVVYFFIVMPTAKIMARFKPPVVEPPATKKCPQCKSEIPIDATRCAHCTQAVA
ncbi:MAG TPA: large conductance mechanosensitive channel protein MscL [Terracidiphilus sp.]|nr:large conductance mechanosensitive channel protein MscL [Terracidiphilus sp.]